MQTTVNNKSNNLLVWPKMNVVIRADASVTIGTGHVMRCLTLANQLRQKGAKVTFLCRELKGNLCDYISGQGFRIYQLPYKSSDSNDIGDGLYEQWLAVTMSLEIQQVEKILSEQIGRLDWLIVDHYALDAQWETQMRKYVERLMVIDDLANRPHECDILLDQNLYENLDERYDGLVPSDCRTMLGPRFAILRPEFVQHRRELPEHSGEIRRVLLFFGGIDVTNETSIALDAVKLLERDDLTFEVVIGGSNQHADEIERRCADMKNAHFHCQIDDMAALMASCDLAIGGGGTTTWERCCLGLPCLTIAVAENQVEVARLASKAGFSRFLGKAPEVVAENISETLKQVMSDPALVRRMSQAGLKVVSGDGIEIVVALLLELIVQSTEQIK